ncbi:hypothetical protein N7516_002456 [Penicillium verrucosum]|uniref:uncharacterized protein n=1 Tax=Penicillium verrucosum TaxID=60171 RepID=UPI0025459897|nr:uncharacterized protein N7516_002456 [Penicillium verrucosum]KAJ5942288.1 hypothetical protein N7516_002456 [Penicillium verrucosum]
MALFTSTATLVNAFSQFVNPIALQAIAWRVVLIDIEFTELSSSFIASFGLKLHTRQDYLDDPVLFGILAFNFQEPSNIGIAL